MRLLACAVRDAILDWVVTKSFSFLRRSLNVLWSASSLVLAFTITGCENKGGGQTAGATGDNVTGTPLPERREGTSFFGSNVQHEKFHPIYFDFDSQSIRTSETEKIQEIANFMKDGGSEVIIAGFTDERGTAEYNRGLGDRRAGAVREHLISQGVDGNRIQTVSFGLEMPADSGHNEAAWTKNRRAEIGVVR